MASEYAVMLGRNFSSTNWHNKVNRHASGRYPKCSKCLPPDEQRSLTLEILPSFSYPFRRNTNKERT